MNASLLSAADLQALWLTLRLAALTTLLLILVGTPLAWWLARTRNRRRGAVEALVALPLVLLGFFIEPPATASLGEPRWLTTVGLYALFGAGAALLLDRLLGRWRR